MDCVVTVPRHLWQDWLDEGDLPGEEAQYESHFWIGGMTPHVQKGDRVYVVAFGRLRGYAPLVRIEQVCSLDPRRRCLVREGGAAAVTIDEEIRGFQGVRRRWWPRWSEIPFPDWQTDGVPQATCLGCGELFIAARRQRASYCSVRCQTQHGLWSYPAQREIEAGRRRVGGS